MHSSVQQMRSVDHEAGFAGGGVEDVVRIVVVVLVGTAAALGVREPVRQRPGSLGLVREADDQGVALGLALQPGLADHPKGVLEPLRAVLDGGALGHEGPVGLRDGAQLLLEGGDLLLRLLELDGLGGGHRLGLGGRAGGEDEGQDDGAHVLLLAFQPSCGTSKYSIKMTFCQCKIGLILAKSASRMLAIP